MQQSLRLNDPLLSGEALPKVEYDLPADMKNWNGMALVGEAPGADEVRLGHPFVGRSGQLLNKTLEAANIVRADCLVMNVFRFQPPGNKVDHFFISKRKARELKTEIAECYGPFGSVWCRSEFAEELKFLAATLQRLRPRVIVGLGRTPLWALTGANGLLAKVGQPMDCRFLPETKVIPTYHPSFILRGNWGLQPQWTDHFLYAKQLLKRAP